MLLGKWTVKGWFRTAPDRFVSGWESYRWLRGKHFLEGRWRLVTTDIGLSEVSEGIILIGPNKQQEGYIGRNFDSNGNSSEFRFTIDEQHFNIENEYMRYLGTFNKRADVITGAWQILDSAGTGTYWYDKQMIKVK